MTGTTNRLPLEQAQSLAAELVQLLSPYCTRVDVVGSIRRKRPDVKDIELLVEPAVTKLVTDLFGGTTDFAALDGLIDHALREGVFAPRLDKNGRPALGERYKRLLFGDVALDLFICRPPAQYGVLQIIRTGPAEFSHRLVTQRRFGGLLSDGWRVHDGALYDDQNQLRITPFEADVFALIGLDYIKPEYRH